MGLRNLIGLLRILHANFLSRELPERSVYEEQVSSAYPV
jgi:hypothetical protein